MQNFMGRRFLSGIGLCMALLLQGLPTYADTFYVSATTGNDANDGSQSKPWKTIAKATQSVQAGAHTIMVAAGTYNEESFALPVGVSLQGAGIGQTLITNRTFTWWQGGIRLVSAQVTDGNQSVSGFTFSGDPNSTFSGIQVRNRNNVKIFNVKVELFYHAGIEILADYGLKIRNIEIADFIVSESSRESGGACYGNILGRGNIENIQIHDGSIYHQTNIPVGTFGEHSSGYAIKFTAAYGTSDFSHNDYVSKSKLYNIKQYGKTNGAWGGTDFPNLAFEFWHVGGEEVEIYNCDFTAQISLEYEPPIVKGAYSFWVHDNRFKVFTQQSVELTTSNAIIENNVFDYRTNLNPWNVMGEYNQKPKGGDNIHIRKNYFILGNSSPVIWAVGNAAKGLYFYNNTITGTGTPALFQIRSTCGTKASEDLRVFNNVFDLGNSGNITVVTYEPGTSQPINLLLANNHHSKPFVDLPGGASTPNNKQTNPAISRVGELPLPFLSISGQSDLIDAGLASLPLAPVPMSFAGNSPDIGAFESNSSVANQPPVVSWLSPAEGASFNAGAVISLSANASDSDGSVTKVEFFAGTTKVGEATAAPWNVNWTNAAVGTYTLTAKATDNKGATKTSSTLTITVKAVNQAPVVALTSPSSGASLTEGATVTLSANASDSDGSVAKVEFFVNNIKQGESSSAPWTVSWTAANAGSYTLTAKATDNQGASTTSAAVSVVVNAVVITPPTPNQAPVVSLSSPTNGATYKEGTVISLTANASDSDGSVAKVEFFVNNIKQGESTSAPWGTNWTAASAGTYTLTAKATDNQGASTTSAAVSVVVEEKVIVPNKLPSVALVSPRNGGSFTEGSSLTMMANASDADGSVVKVEFFAGTTKIGEVTSSPWIITWNNVPVGAHVLTAQATDNQGGTNISTSVSVTITPAVTPPATNVPPVVSVTTPIANASYTEGEIVTISANASDSDGSVAKVEFFAGTTKVGEATAAPWSVNWTAVAGSYVITAKATDNKALSTVSSGVAITVQKVVTPPTPNQAPVVSLSSPSSGASLTEGATVTLSANASDSDGSVAKVEFFVNNIKQGESTSAPWTVSWTAANAGSYTLTAKATDNQGASTTSAAVSVVVNAVVITPPTPNQAPVVSLSSPTNGATYKEGTVISLSANASDSDGSVAKVEFFAGTTKVGEATAAPWSVNWDKPTNGTYVLTAKATDNQNAVTVSTSVTIIVELVPSGGNPPGPVTPTPTCSASGTILREVWNNIPSYMNTMIPVYKQPDNSIQLSSFEGPTNVADNYSSRIRGYICPPADGAYTFWISGSEQAELWLGVNEDPTKKIKIAYVAGGTNPLERTRSSTQQSAPIRLLKGKKYYIEAVHKARKGNDNLAVSWKLPNGTLEAPIAGASLSPYLPKAGEFDAPPLQVGTLNVFPNPADNLVNLQFAVESSQKVLIKITNMNSQEILTLTQEVQIGENTVALNVAALRKGIYVVHIRTKEGKLSKKLLIYR